MLCLTLKTSKWQRHFIPLDSARRTDWVRVISSKKTDSMRNGHVPGEAHAQAPCEDEVPCRDTWAELGALRSRVWYLPWSTELTPPTPALPWAWGLSTHPSLLDWAEDVIASSYWVFSLPVSQLTSAHMLLQAPQSKPAGLASTFKQQFFDNQIILTETS